MPYDGSGNFSIINNFEEDRINGVSIDSLKMDNNFNDVANGLSQCMLRSAGQAMTGALNMGSHKITNVTAGTANTDAVNKGQMDTALSAKQNTITGGATTITSSNLTASRALVSNSSGKVAVSAVTSTELGYLDGVTSAIQTQLNAKAADTAVVHLADAETITGQKTFTSTTKQKNNHLIYNENITKGTNPSATQYINNYMAGDSMSVGDTSALGLFRTYVTSTGAVNSAMEAFKNTSGSSAHFDIRAVYDTANNRYWAQISSGNSGTDTNYSLSYATSATDNTYIPTMGWVNNPAASTNVVHRSGDETINGKKNFTNAMIVSFPNITKGTNPSSAQYMGISIPDKNGTANANRLGLVETSVSTTGLVSTYITAYKYTSGTTTNARIAVIYPTSGSAYTEAPEPTDTYSATSGAQIATTGWTASNFVNLAGSQTITGTKTFTQSIIESNGDPRVVLKNTDITKGTAPANDEINAFQIRDKDNNLLGSFQTQYQTSKRIATQMVAYKAQSASDTDSVRMGIGYDIEGNASTWAPACDHDQSIVTTIDKTKASKGHFWLGNGLLVNWGRETADDADVHTVSFDKAFSANPCIFLNFNRTNDTVYSTGANTDDSLARNVSTTGFKFNNQNIGSDASVVWYAIGYRNS